MTTALDGDLAARLERDGCSAAALGLVVTLHAAGRLEQAIAACEWVLAREPTCARGYEALACLLPAVGRGEELGALLDRWVRHRPDDATAVHLHGAWGGGHRDIARASCAYVVELFDEFAPSFDVTVAGLEYAAPRVVAAALGRALAPRRATCCLDAGCGTGLVGVEIRDAVTRLIGVDLSAAMLERAAVRGIYDALSCEDLIGHLHAHAGVYDAIVAADVLVYFGALDEVADAIACALVPGGIAIVTTELAQQLATPWVLRRSGRFAHRADATIEAFAAAGLIPVASELVTLRRERGDAVLGTCTTARRPERRTGG